MAANYASIDMIFTEKAADFRAVSTFIHTHPELAFEEHKCHDFLVEKLRKNGFNVIAHYLKCDTAFRATYEGTPGGPTICVMCEYDALPDVGHACGHNLIAEAGYAAGIGIKAFLENNPDVKGKVVVLGTPAEESNGGKQKLIDGGAFKDIDVAMMVHPSNTANEATPLFIGVNVLLAEFYGKAAHAAGYPWDGRNALDGAVSCYNALSMLRQHLKPNCKVHVTIKSGGTAANIVPDYASLIIMYRAPSIAELEELAARVDDCVKAGALVSATKSKVSPLHCTYLPLQSNETLAQLYKQHCEMDGMKFDGAEKLGTFVASSDVGNVSWIVPTIQPIFRIDAKGPNHSVAFTEAAGEDCAQANTLIAARALAKSAADIFCQPKLLAAVKEEFNKK